MSESYKIYRKLQQHLDKLPVGFPSTVSGVEIKVLKHLFTLKEAHLALILNTIPKTARQVYKKVKKLNFSRHEVEKHLNNMDRNGVIYGIKKGNRVYYKNQILAVGMYEYQVKRVSKEFMQDMVQYLKEAFAKELTITGSYQARIIPVEKSIQHEMDVYDYDNVRKTIEKYKGQIAITDCICRVGHDKMGTSCKNTELRESCLVFRGAAQYYIDHGFARPISKEKVFQIIEQAEKDSLVIQMGNSKKFYFICLCCKCCCEGLRAVLRAEFPAKIYKNNYNADIDSKSCTLCKTCIERCQSQALTVNNEKININLKRCIGCGLCITSCPEKALRLIKNASNYKPYKTNFRLYLSLLSKKSGRWAGFKSLSKLIFSFKLNYILRKKRRNYIGE
jgi:formate hydrogenlyase subunit 6/NADH:ubiquinone oxidoreductase subunit I